MRENNGYSGTHLMIAFAGGAAVGAAVALLTAPHTGRETRELIAERARSTKQTAQRLPSAVKSAGSAAREAFSDALGEHEH